MSDFLDIIEGNLGSFPHICAELLDFLPDSLEVRLLLMQQYLEGLRGNMVAPLDNGMGHPVVELWTFETIRFNGHSVLPEAGRVLFWITDTTTANQGCAGRGLFQVALKLRPIGFAELVEPM